MWKLLNFRNDRRTYKNILIFPILILIRVPAVLLFWGSEYINVYLEKFIDRLPGWDSK